LNVAGAWHNKLMDRSVDQFRDFLASEPFAKPNANIVDNVTAELLPAEPEALCQQLALHLARPVLWQNSIKYMSQMGVKEFVEFGQSDTLTKFGLMIERRAHHRTYLYT